MHHKLHTYTHLHHIHDFGIELDVLRLLIAKHDRIDEVEVQDCDHLALSWLQPCVKVVQDFVCWTRIGIGWARHGAAEQAMRVKAALLTVQKSRTGVCLNGAPSTLYIEVGSRARLFCACACRRTLVV